MTTKNVTPNQDAAEKLRALSEVLLEHVVDFDGKLEEVMANFESSIEEMVERKVAERIEKRLKELGYA